MESKTGNAFNGDLFPPSPERKRRKLGSSERNSDFKKKQQKNETSRSIRKAIIHNGRVYNPHQEFMNVGSEKTDNLLSNELIFISKGTINRIQVPRYKLDETKSTPTNQQRESTCIT